MGFEYDFIASEGKLSALNKIFIKLEGFLEDSRTDS